MTVALITGSSTGIGLATALQLARNGYTVYASMRQPDKATELQATVQAEGLDLCALAGIKVKSYYIFSNKV